MKIEIISTGEEILTGSITDTNSGYIAAILENERHNVIRHTTVGDDFNSLVELFKESGQRADVTLVTGGLGPTIDDRSVEAACKAAETEPEINNNALKSVRKYFERFGKVMTESDKKQVYLPKTATCIKNDSGTAPGFSMKIGNSHFFFMPGVPWEMKAMLKKNIIQSLIKLSGVRRKKLLKKSFFLFGLPEAVVNQRLLETEEKFSGIKTGFRADFPVIEIKINIEDSEKNSNEIFNRAQDWIYTQVGKYIFSETTGNMEQVVGSLLTEKNRTLAVAESCTGGLIGHKMTDVPGSSNYFLTSCVTYSNEAKINILGVKKETIDNHGAVSYETVSEMAENIRKLTDADYAIATSGIAGPDGGSSEKPVGTVFIGFSCSKGIKSEKFTSPFRDRTKNKIIFCIKTLDFLRREILNNH